MQPILDIEHLAELYQKLKGSIFLRLVSYQFGSIFNTDIKELIQKKFDSDRCIFQIRHLNRDLTFEEFVYRCQNQF